MLVGFDQQILPSTPPVNEMVHKGDRLAPVAASGGGTMERRASRRPVGTRRARRRSRTRIAGRSGYRRRAGVEAVVDLVAGGRIASFMVDGHELLKTSHDGPRDWGSFPMAPYAGRNSAMAELTFGGTVVRLPSDDAAARHPRHGPRSWLADR